MTHVMMNCDIYERLLLLLWCWTCTRASVAVLVVLFPAHKARSRSWRHFDRGRVPVRVVNDDFRLSTDGWYVAKRSSSYYVIVGSQSCANELHELIHDTRLLFLELSLFSCVAVLLLAAAALLVRPINSCR